MDPHEFKLNALSSVHPKTLTLREAQQFGVKDEKRNLLINKPSDFAGLLLSSQLAAGNGVSGQALSR